MRIMIRSLCFLLFTLVYGCQVLNAAPTIKIGIVAELSGDDENVGQSHIKGAQLAIEEINQQGGLLGQSLELVIENNQGTNPGSVLALNQLIKKNQLSALITPNRSTQILSMMSRIEQLAIPTFIGGTDSALTKINNSWVFRMRPHDGYSAQAMVKFGVSQLASKKWAIIYSSDNFGINGKNSVIDALKKQGLAPVLVQSINLTSQDYSLPLTLLKQSGADVLATYLSGPSNSGRFAIQFRDAGLNINWIGSSSLGTRMALNISKNALIGAYVLSSFSNDMNQESVDFSTRFFKKYHTYPDYYAAWTYDSVQLYAHAANQVKSTIASKVRQRLANINNYRGVNGLYRFDQYRDGLHSYSVFLIKPEKLILMKTFQFDW